MPPTSPVDRPRGPGPEALGFGFFLGMLLSFSTMEALGKLIAQTYPVVQTVWARYTFHFLLLLVAMAAFRLARRDFGIRRSRRPAMQLLRSLALFAMTFSYFHSLARLPIADATAIVFAAPLVTTALSGIALGERAGWREWCAVFVGFAGVVIVVRPLSILAALSGQADALPPGAMVGFAAGGVAAVMYALYMISSRIVSMADSPATGLLYSAIAGVIGTNVMVPFEWRTPDLQGWGLLVLLGFLGGLGQYLAGFAFARVPASRLAPLTYIQLLFAVAYGIVLFSTVPTLNTLAGSALIVLAGLYTYRRAGSSPP